MIQLNFKFITDLFNFFSNNTILKKAGHFSVNQETFYWIFAIIPHNAILINTCFNKPTNQQYFHCIFTIIPNKAIHIKSLFNESTDYLWLFNYLSRSCYSYIKVMVQ